MPLAVVEPGSALVHAWLSDDDHTVTWSATRTEITSAIEHRPRDGTLSREQRREALRRFDALAKRWDEITDVLAVRSRAHALLARHLLRAADAGQLGAARLVQEQMAGVLTFVCLDSSLALAAEREQRAIIIQDTDSGHSTNPATPIVGDSAGIWAIKLALVAACGARPRSPAQRTTSYLAVRLGRADHSSGRVNFPSA